MTTTIDLRTNIANNTKFGSKTVKVNKLEDVLSFDTTGAIAGQVEVIKKGGRLVLNVYKLAGAVQYTYRIIQTIHDHARGKSGYPKWITTYDYDKEGNLISRHTDTVHVSSPGSGIATYKYQVFKDGKLFKAVKSESEFANYVSSDGKSVSKTVLGSYTFTNVNDAGDGIKVWVNGEDILSKQWEVTPNISGYFSGTELNEIAYSTSKSENFNLKGGQDTIDYHTKGATHGTDIINLTKDSNINLDFGMGAPAKVERKDKNSSDIVVYLGNNEGSNGKIIIKEYLRKDSAIVSINGTSLNTYLGTQNIGDSGATKKQTLVGTSLNENFYCGLKDDVVLTGSGNDCVYVGAGNSTIKVEHTGQKDIYINGQNAKYSVARNNQYATAVVKLHNLGSNLIFTRGTNSYDLTIKRAGGETTVKGFFYEGDAFKKTYASDDNFANSLGERLKNDNFKLTYDFSTSSKVTVKGSKYSDKIYGGERTSYIYAEDGNNEIFVNNQHTGKMKMTAGDGNDIYNIQNDMSKEKNKYTIKDNGGNNDKIVCTSPGMFAFFDVKIDKNGNFASNETTLHFLETNKVLGGQEKIKKAVKSAEKITIEKALKVSDSDATDKGWIEYVNDTYKSSYTVNTIRSAVAGWLSANNYSSVTQAINKETNEANLQQLMQIYSTNYSV